ncbi:MAG TPA: hypothetical protein VEM14_07545 [Gemmatimonadaceae bacterium]|nr:hypothetical protein [Gemmatimonadaceae bacterium]
MSQQDLHKREISVWLRRLALIVLSTSCGPALTEPASLNISGRWSTSDAIGPVTMLQLDLAESPDGTVQGQWSGKLVPADATCPPSLGPTPTGPITGTNTVLALNLSILGTGDFQGQALDDRTLRGSVFSCGIFYRVTFTLVGPVPGG